MDVTGAYLRVGLFGHREKTGKTNASRRDKVVAMEYSKATVMGMKGSDDGYTYLTILTVLMRKLCYVCFLFNSCCRM